MWIADIDLPDALIAAQRERRLVVFVGAGASVGSPSNLPTFAGLTHQIFAAAHVAVDPDRQDFDQLLGDLEADHDVDVHDRARQLLDPATSQPTALHLAIAGLFAEEVDVRVVTTNYDRHLTTALRSRFGDDLPIYRAPALPLGRDFSGLVYLHGCVDQEPRRLVVTDKDFGTAYLVEAWAARFLEAMFHHDYAVMFVGYSHSDAVMTYLARGLRGHTQRYSFVPDNEDPSRWRRLDITPVPYPSTVGGHDALAPAISEWATQAGFGLLDHASKMAKILRGGGGELSPNDNSYLADVLTRANTAQFFCRHTSDTSWLTWLEQQPVFQRLFDADCRDGDVEFLLALWFANTIAVSHPESAMATVERQGGWLSPLLASTILRVVSGPKPPDAGVVNRWTALLVSQERASALDHFDYLLHDCQLPDDRDRALVLFDHLTRPRLVLRPGIGSYGGSSEDLPDVAPDLVLAGQGVTGDGYMVRQAWMNTFKPQLGNCAVELSAIVTANLLSCWQLLRMFDGDPPRFDWLAERRSAIEAHEQNSDGDLDVLIDAARDVLDALLIRDDGTGPGLLANWSQSPGAIFRRLVIHGWTVRTDVSSDAKLRWLLRNERIVEGGPARHEAFQLLRMALPTAGEKIKTRVLKRSLQRPRLGRGVDAESRAYVTYNLLYWLTICDPSFEAARTEFERLQQEHPQFGPREYPDFDSWHSSGTSAGPTSPISQPDLASLDLTTEWEWLLSYQAPERGFMAPSRDGLLQSVRHLAAANFDWGVSLIGVLQTHEALSSDLATAILDGWERQPFADEQWQDVLSTIELLPDLLPHLRSLTRLLQYALANDGTLPFALLPQACALAERLWRAGLDGGDEPWVEVHPKVDRWLNRAFNHWAGDLARFWIGAVSTYWRADPDGWTGLPTEAAEHLTQMIAGEGSAADSARSIFGTDLHFLLAADEAWTEQHLLPCFDWSANRPQAEQVWDGYLHNARWNDRLVTKLLPYLHQSFSLLGADLEPRQREVCALLANVAVYGTQDPLALGWLEPFAAVVDAPTAGVWADSVYRVLKAATPDVCAAQWERWILPYWRRRSASVPRAMTDEEAASSAQWLLFAGTHLPEAAELALQWRLTLPHGWFFIRAVVDNAIVKTHPALTVRLLASMLEGTQQLFHGCEELETLAIAAAAQTPRDDFVRFCNEAARLGCNQATEWLSHQP